MKKYTRNFQLELCVLIGSDIFVIPVWLVSIFCIWLNDRHISAYFSWCFRHLLRCCMRRTFLWDILTKCVVVFFFCRRVCIVDVYGSEQCEICQVAVRLDFFLFSTGLHCSTFDLVCVYILVCVTSDGLICPMCCWVHLRGDDAAFVCVCFLMEFSFSSHSRCRMPFV